MTRVPKSAKNPKFSHKLYTDKSRNIIVVGGKKVKILTNGCFDYLQFSIPEPEHIEEPKEELDAQINAPAGTCEVTADNLLVRLLKSKSKNLMIIQPVIFQSQSTTSPS